MPIKAQYVYHITRMHPVVETKKIKKEPGKLFGDDWKTSYSETLGKMANLSHIT